MAGMKKAVVILSAVCVLLAAVTVFCWNRINSLETSFSRAISGVQNAIPFCMKVANAYVDGDAEEIIGLSRGETETDFPGLDAYQELDLAFDGLQFPISRLGGEGAYLATIRYRLLSDVPTELSEVIPPAAIEERDGKRYIYQQFSVYYEYDKLKEENVGWSYAVMDFRGKPFSGPGVETELKQYGDPG